MRMSMLTCKQITPSLNIPDGRHVLPFLRSSRPPKEKVVVVMGATGTGKSKLSIDLATRLSGEVVNSDKMQVYEGLDIITNKITEEEACDVPHHLFGIIDPNVDFTSTNFCSMASLAIRSIAGRRKLPIIVGGSNSFIEALVEDEIHEFRSRQLEKIYRLRNNKGWKVHRLDATDAFLKHGKESDRAWDELVAAPMSDNFGSIDKLRCVCPVLPT
ncbi:Adenylate isopentenyltransferase 3, chloroplastic [Heracleum sosnowskyi]|uniref:Adenylate isopentenyltransferase 3, chloroplastic n=1 Tax=Heracleum sosnowskyi TaxID=360622 RepID=A0AAD8N7S3_9APIA|nr:Adenylate isopentenyltransferase 3, chloroplastic [Heracleum sosnowskyi]